MAPPISSWWRLIKSGGEKRNDVLSYEDLIGMEMSPGKSLKRDDLNQKIEKLKDQSIREVNVQKSYIRP